MVHDIIVVVALKELETPGSDHGARAVLDRHIGIHLTGSKLCQYCLRMFVAQKTEEKRRAAPEKGDDGSKCENER